MIITVKI